LRTWTKDPTCALLAPEAQGYEPHDWRDPFVFRDERSGQWAMLLAARRAAGASRRRGCTALLTSPDLRQWTVQQPFWAPEAWFTHECPDLFRWG
ncbi:beta-fructofuranosidase, partial [Clostridium perfringens]|nr:beta-fructofuranosidase [Clostridium perfringens]